MSNTLQTILRTAPRPYLTDIELATVLRGTLDSRYGKVKRCLAKGDLLHIRRGLYCVNHHQKPHPLELAQYIYGPSYISLESALSFHQLIPEAVYTMTSVTTKRAKSFSTPLGLFSYEHLPIENFYIQVDKIQENGHVFFMAQPWKAICDYLYCYKKNWIDIEPLIEDLRINVNELPPLCVTDVQALDDYYKSSRISRFLRGVHR